jgi:hypothetical protein
MSPRLLALTLAAAFALAACAGGGTTNPAAPANPPASSAPVVAPQGHGSIPMSFTFRRKGSSAGRRPQYLSNNTSSIAIYDGTTLVYVANVELDSGTQFSTVFASSGSTTVAPDTCSFTNTSATCGLTITTTIGAHKFDVSTYPVFQGLKSVARAPMSVSSRRTISDTGTPPVFEGVILSEGELSVTVSPGTNPGQTLHLNGVADQLIFAGLSENAYNTTTTFGYQIEDSGGAQIVTPGTFDNGPVTITASPDGIVTISPNSFTTPPASDGDQNFGVTCINTAGGPVTLSFNAATSPDTTYASGLTYSTSNYSGSVIQTIPFTCDPATGTIPITVDGRHS